MHNITLISTIHTESGRCNSDELYKIIEGINPDVIFDELPSHLGALYYSESLDVAYDNKFLNNQSRANLLLEVKCIKRYRQNHNVKIVAVDIEIFQDLAEQKELYFLFSKFFNYEEYNNIDIEREALIANEGFNFLNSDKFLELLEKKEQLERTIVESEVHKDRLLIAYDRHRKQIDDRERAMLVNIYKYCKENQFTEAVFLIGADHKKSIMQKIIEYERHSEIKLNWRMLGN